MSGIAGILYPDVFQITHLVSPMLEALDHRGQGVRDVYTYRNVQLGSCGQKLGTNARKTIFCAIDGSIVNKQALIKQLNNQGFVFSETPNDSELTVAAYEAWGNAFPEHINGNFAIALFDQTEGKFLLVRDRIGVKPLYWFHRQNLFIFASELKSILCTGAVSQTLAPDALSSYLYFGYIPQDMTIIQGVNKLLPGYTLTYSLEQRMHIEPYWSLSAFFQNPHKESPHGVIHHLDQLIKKSVKSRLSDEESVGCFVSGGLGSACTAYYVKSNVKNTSVEAFTTGFQSHNDADIDAANEVAKTLSIPHTTKILTPYDLVQNLSKIVWYLDEPVADPNVAATWYLAALAAENTHTVFSGMGSDEFLAGHSRYTSAVRKISPYKAWFQKFLKEGKPVLIPLLHAIWEPLALRLLKETRSDPWQLAHMQRNAVFDLNTLELAAPKLAGLFDPQVFMHKFHHLYRIENQVGALLYLDIKTRLADSYIHQYERMCTAHGLSWQTPFLDRDLMEFAAGIPEPDALTELETASVLKELLKGTFSPTFLNRPKRTRENFLCDWAALPPLLELFHRLPHGTLVEIGIISEKWLREQIRNIQSSPTTFKQLWSILILELWVRIFINRRIDYRSPEQSPIELISHVIHLHD